MNWLRVLDLCCCEGGCSRGYEIAGFRPYGADIFEDYTQARYPYPSYKGDAVTLLRRLLEGGTATFVGRDGVAEVLGLRHFAFAHISPPCQKWSITNAARQAEYPDLIAVLRELAIATGLPYVLENVLRAPVEDPIELCGCMFDLHATDTDGVRLNMWRPRLFESNVPLLQPRPGTLKIRDGVAAAHDPAFHAYEWVGGSYGGARRDKYEAKFIRKGGYVPSIPVQQELLGIDWMTQKGMHQSIPPVYAEFVGRQVLAQLAVAA